jgi:hypothetical protein
MGLKEWHHLFTKFLTNFHPNLSAGSKFIRGTQTYWQTDWWFDKPSFIFKVGWKCVNMCVAMEILLKDQSIYIDIWTYRIANSWYTLNSRLSGGGLTSLRVNHGCPPPTLSMMSYKEFACACELTLVCHYLWQQHVSVQVYCGKMGWVYC